MTHFDTTMTRRLVALAVLGAATAGMASCSTGEDTDPAEADPTEVGTVSGAVELPDGAWAAATSAADQCEQATPQLIAGTIATVSGYDPDYSDEVGRQGYAALAPVQWDTFGTGDAEQRSDLTAATDAVAAQLCEGFAAAERIDPDADAATAEELALSVVLFGERYTTEYGVTPVGEENDPHMQRAHITDIQNATASVSA